MCDYCKTIYNNLDEIDKDVFPYHKIEHGIARNNDKFDLYIPCDDNFYAPIAEDIKYCPYCGRKLT